MTLVIQKDDVEELFEERKKNCSCKWIKKLLLLPAYRNNGHDVNLTDGAFVAIIHIR
jgi:hypothetical protein